jgi:hypothetical protein
MLIAFAPLHPAFARWNRKANSRAAANRPFCAMPPDIDDLARTFAKNPVHPGSPRSGYSAYAWNGKNSPYGLSISVDAGDDSSFYLFPNNVTIILSPRDAANADLINIAVLQPALLALVAAWDPHWVTIQPWAYWERWSRAEPWDDEDYPVKRPDGYIPRITSGWMMYLCVDYARRITPPRGIDSERVAGGGLLMMATREIFTAGDPTHDAAADAIQDALLPLQNLPRD